MSLMLCLFSLLIFFPLKRLPFTFVIVYNEYKCSYMWFLSVNTWSYLCGDMSSYPCHCHVIVMSSSWLIIAIFSCHWTCQWSCHSWSCYCSASFKKNLHFLKRLRPFKSYEKITTNKIYMIFWVYENKFVVYQLLYRDKTKFNWCQLSSGFNWASW